MQFEECASGLLFPEGPIACRDGSVLVVEIARGTLTRVRPDGSTEVVAECGGGPNGAAFGPDGAVYVTNNGGCFAFVDLGGFLFPGDLPTGWTGGCIQRVDLSTGIVETLYEQCDGRPLRAPNDLVFDEFGGFWFTDYGVRQERTSDRTGVFYAQPDGSSITEVVFPMEAPNGIGLSPDGAWLYVAETFTGRLWRWAVSGPGQVEKPSTLHAGGDLVHGAPGLQLFDSLAVDAEGRVCVATLNNGGITVIGADGDAVQHIATDDPLTTNICFGGADLMTAYVTLSGTGRLVRAAWPSPGAALHGTEPGRR